MIRFKTSHLIAAVPLLLSLTGCVAALPLVAQLATGATSTAQLCAMTKLPGQTLSLCDRIPLAAAAPAPNGSAAKTTVR